MASRAQAPVGAVVVGLDVGTTGAKAVAFGLASSWRHVVVREYPLLEPVAGWQVQHPDAVVAAAAECIRQAAPG